MSQECYIGTRSVPKKPNPKLDAAIDSDSDLKALKNREAESSSEVFGVVTEDRRKHFYIVGKTGTGKTTLLTNMILQDIYNGLGVCFIDPHGDSSEYILDRIPPHRHKDVIYFNPADIDYPIGLNILESQRGEEPFLITSTLIAVFNKIWQGTWSSRMEYILSNTLLTLLETEGNTLLGVVKLLTDEKYRRKIVSRVRDPLVKNFWQLEFAKFNEKYRQEAVAPILNKIGQFFSNEVIRNILGQSKSTIDFRDIMDNNKILIANLSKGRLGEENSDLLGSLLISKLQIATMSRVDTPENKRQDFYVYVDEFQNFTTDSFAGILSEARKYRLNLILAHQYIAQLVESGTVRVKNAIFGNVGTIIAFRLGSSDAKEISNEFSQVINSDELMNLQRSRVGVKLSTENQHSKAFLASTLPPLFDKISGQLQLVTDISRSQYARNRKGVREEIMSYLKEIDRPTDVLTKSKKPQFEIKNKDEVDTYIDSFLESRSGNVEKFDDSNNFRLGGMNVEME
jgi:Type IV secretion-system coupling protein DNA-binding domain